MLDIKYVRDNQAAVAEAMENRHASWDAARFSELDETRRAAIAKEEALQAERNAASKSIGAMMGAGQKDEAEAAKERVRAINDELAVIGKEREAAERAQARAVANLENTAACRQARERYNAILAEASPDPATWGERSQAAQAQMEMNCLGAAAYQQLQQSRALQPNAINRPQWGYGYPNRYPPAHPTPSQPPAKIVNCNVFRCYDNRGGVHPIP